MIHFLRFFCAACGMLLLVWLGGCAVSSSGSGNGLFITPPSATLAPSASLQFNANLPVTWSVLEPSGGGSISSTGLYQAGSSTGVFQVVATSVSDGTITTRARVTVTNSGGSVNALTAAPLADTVKVGSAHGGILVRVPEFGGTVQQRVIGYLINRFVTNRK